MGIIATLKVIAPLSIYTAGIIGILLALTGKVRWALMIVLLLCPLRNVIEKMQSLPAGGQFLDMLFASMLAGWVISSLSTSKPFMSKTFINTPAIMLVCYMFFSLLAGNYVLTGTFILERDASRVMDWKNFTLLPILFFIMVNNLPDKLWVMRAFWMMIGTMVLMEYYIFSQVNMYSAIESRVKITGTFEFLGPNEVAAFLNQNTVILSGIYLCMRKHWIKLVMLGLILVNVYCIIFLYSRGAYMGLFLGMMILFLFRNKKLLIPAILILVFWQAVLPVKVIERIQGTTNQYGELDESSELRLVMWEKSMEMFRKSPLFGIGYGLIRFQDFGTGLSDTHNIYVKILTEQGVIGFILFLIVVFTFCRQGFVLYQKGNDDLAKGLGLGLFASMFTLLVNNFFGDRWAYFELSAYTWAFAALAARFSQLTETESQVQPAVEKVSAQKIRVNEKTVQVKKPRKSYYK